MAKINTNKLLVAEHFYSVQGEGKTSGYPAYFIRLGLCNLSCGFSPNYVNDYKKGRVVHQTAGTIVGDLQLQNKATWTCDTMPVWIRGEEMEFIDLIESWVLQGIYDEIVDGTIHIIWTGGEPTIPGHQESIVNFIKFWQQYENSMSNIPPLNFGYHEIETNGTIYIEDDLFNVINQINCSPKLSNSGMLPQQRIIEQAINRIQSHKNYQFKFVISTEDDIFEMFETYINEFKMSFSNVCCMPGLDSQEDFFERTKWVMEMSKKYFFIGLTRLHVAAWDKTTGV